MNRTFCKKLPCANILFYMPEVFLHGALWSFPMNQKCCVHEKFLPRKILQYSTSHACKKKWPWSVNKSWCAIFRCRFLNGDTFVSLIVCLTLLLLRQLPFESSNHIFPIRRSISLFHTNFITIESSLVTPDCRCIPKYFSKGSWQMKLLWYTRYTKNKNVEFQNEETMHNIKETFIKIDKCELQSIATCTHLL